MRLTQWTSKTKTLEQINRSIAFLDGAFSDSGCVAMWFRDLKGTDFESANEAMRELRLRAERAILDGDAAGLDVRKWVVRLRDNAGSVLFEGSLDDAARASLDDEGTRPH